MTYSQAQIKALFAAVVSAAEGTGTIARTATHEPENTPGRGISCSVTLGEIAATEASGLASVSGVIAFQCRLWSSLLQRPLDNIDPDLLVAVSALLNAFAGGFTFGQTVRNVDLLKLRARPGYIPDDEGKPMRVIDITVPVIVNDLWAEVA